MPPATKRESAKSERAGCPPAVGTGQVRKLLLVNSSCRFHLKEYDGNRWSLPSPAPFKAHFYLIPKTSVSLDFSAPRAGTS